MWIRGTRVNIVEDSSLRTTQTCRSTDRRYACIAIILHGNTYVAYLMSCVSLSVVVHLSSARYACRKRGHSRGGDCRWRVARPLSRRRSTVTPATYPSLLGQDRSCPPVTLCFSSGMHRFELRSEISATHLLRVAGCGEERMRIFHWRLLERRRGSILRQEGI